MGAVRRADVAAANNAASGRGSSASGAASAAASNPQSARRSCLTSQLKKTKICMYHLKGSCHFGQDCAFAHTCIELQATPDLRKTRLCRAFEMGACDNVDCGFAHGEAELRSTDLFYKRTLCIWNEKGKCRNGDQCRFAHGAVELRAGGSGSLGAGGAGGASSPGGANVRSPGGGQGAGGQRRPKAATYGAAAPAGPARAPMAATASFLKEPMKVSTPVGWEAAASPKHATLVAAISGAGRSPTSQQLKPVTPGGKLESDLTLEENLQRLRDHLSELTEKCGRLWQLQSPLGDASAAGYSQPVTPAAWPPGGMPPGLESELDTVPLVSTYSAGTQAFGLPEFEFGQGHGQGQTWQTLWGS